MGIPVYTCSNIGEVVNRKGRQILTKNAYNTLKTSFNDITWEIQLKIEEIEHRLEEIGNALEESSIAFDGMEDETLLAQTIQYKEQKIRQLRSEIIQLKEKESKQMINNIRFKVVARV